MRSKMNLTVLTGTTFKTLVRSFLIKDSSVSLVLTASKKSRESDFEHALYSLLFIILLWKPYNSLFSV